MQPFIGTFVGLSPAVVKMPLHPAVVFCLSEGPSKEAVMKIHERAGHPTVEVYEVSVQA